MPSDGEQEKGEKSHPSHPLVIEENEHTPSPPPSKKPKMTAAADTSSDCTYNIFSFPLSPFAIKVRGVVVVVADKGEVGMIVMSRLNAFLPAMEAADKDLQAEIKDGTVGKRNIEVLDREEEEEEEEEARYIEMVSE